MVVKNILGVRPPGFKFCLHHTWAVCLCAQNLTARHWVNCPLVELAIQANELLVNLLAFTLNATWRSLDLFLMGNGEF